MTGKDGYIRVPGLEAGYYYVQEIEAPEGYLLDSTRHQVRVENFEVTLLQLKNYEKTTLVVEKVDAQSKVPLGGVCHGRQADRRSLHYWHQRKGQPHWHRAWLVHPEGAQGPHWLCAQRG